MSPRTLTISRLAASADVHVETVRYYQRRGLLHVPERPARGVRCYGAGDVSRLRFIRRAQAIGFSLDEIAGLLNLGGESSCERMQLLVEAIHEGALGEVRHLIHIGIGGSALGPALALGALSRDLSLVDV